MADITVLCGMVGTHEQRSANSKILWVNSTTGYVCLWDNTGSTFGAYKTTDGGATWVEVDAAGAPAANPRSMGFYWEAQNGDPFDADKCHIGFLDATDHEAQHVSFDKGSETWGSIATAHTYVSVSGTSSQSAADMAVATNGDILLVTRADQDGEVSADLWDESGSSWSQVGDEIDSEPWWGDFQEDNVAVEVSNVGIDFMVAMWDQGGDHMRIRGYRVSSDDWTPETSIFGLANEPATDFHNNLMAMVYDWINDEILFVIQTAQVVSTGDIRAWTFNWDGTDVAPTVTSEEDIITNDETMMLVSLTFDPINEEIYCHYAQGTIESSVNIHYKKSPILAYSWDSESSAYLATDDDYRMIRGSVITVAGGRVQPTVFDDDDLLLLVSDSKDVEILPLGGGTTAPSEGEEVALNRDYGVAATIIFKLTQFGESDFATSSEFTHAAGDTKIYKDGGAGVDVDNPPAFVNDHWELDLTATELSAAEAHVSIVDQTASKLINDKFIRIETKGHASAMHQFEAKHFADEMFPYVIDIWVQDDDGNSVDRYGFTPTLGGVRLDGADVASKNPKIRVYEADSVGADLIPLTAVTRTTGEDTFFYEAVTTERMVDGTAYIVEFIFDDMPEPFSVSLGRDG